MGEMKKRGAAPNKSFFRRIAESEFFHNYKRSPSAIVGTVIVVLVLFIALFGPLFAPQNPYDVASLSLTDSYKPPAWEAGGDARFIFGTDSQGRDIFSSLIYGSRISLFIGVVGTLLACAVGITLGLISGYFGGKVDAVIMRLADILLSFPDILVALFIMTMFGRGVSKLLVVFTIIGCVTYIRTVRAEVLTVKQMEYVDAARVIGLPNILIIAKHVLPNVMTTVIVLSTMKVGGLILAEATLSFLGVGVPVTEPSYETFSKQDAETEKEIQNNMEILLKHQVGYEKNFHTEEEWETLINKYRNTRTLTKEMVNAFVEKIEIHESGSITVRLVYDDMLEELRKYAKEREAELCQ